MSRDELKEFLSELSENRDLQNELRSIAATRGGDLAVSAEELVQFAASKSHHFTVEEVESNVELSDDELDGVAGGSGAVLFGLPQLRGTRSAKTGRTTLWTDMTLHDPGRT